MSNASNIVVQAHPRLEIAEILQILRQSIMEGEASIRALERCEVRIDSTLRYLYALESTLANRCPAPPKQSHPKVKHFGAEVTSSTHRATSWSNAEEDANGSVVLLRIEWLPSGGALVLVNNDTKFKLSPTLGHFLQILTRDDGHADDALVRWKSFSEVAGALEAKLGRSFTKRAINQLVYRLRRTLRVRGALNESLVHHHPQLGLRYAVKHRQEM